MRMLEEAGVSWVFGVLATGAATIESLRQSSVQFILTASETSAGFMAATVGYLTGTPGVCASTLGPGATNLTTGVGCAWLYRSPVRAITCNVATPWLERHIQMRIDHHTLFKPLTKASLSFTNGDVGEILAKALNIAVSEPPGPVHLDLPEDVAVAMATEPDESGRTSRACRSFEGTERRGRRRAANRASTFARHRPYIYPQQECKTAFAIPRTTKDSIRYNPPRQGLFAGKPSELGRRHRPGAAH